MATQWLRLWHDMPNDPRWRTVARVSGQPVSLVLSIYVHVLVNASNATERGRTQGLRCEDVASALDCEDAQVNAVLEAMQGRVLDGDRVQGWDKRQPAREDGSADRSAAWRERKKAEKRDANADRTQPNADDAPDTDTDADVSSKEDSAKADLCPHQSIVDLYHDLLPSARRVREWSPDRQKSLRSRWREKPERQSLEWWRDFFEYVAKSDFLCGRTQSAGRKPFDLSLEWLVQPKNFLKVLEGSYEN